MSEGITDGVAAMNEDVLNQQVRKFLKKVGINSQREIEAAVQAGVIDGKLRDAKAVKATMTLQIPELDLEFKLDERIELE